MKNKTSAKSADKSISNAWYQMFWHFLPKLFLAYYWYAYQLRPVATIVFSVFFQSSFLDTTHKYQIKMFAFSLLQNDWDERLLALIIFLLSSQDALKTFIVTLELSDFDVCVSSDLCNKCNLSNGYLNFVCEDFWHAIKTFYRVCRVSYMQLFVYLAAQAVEFHYRWKNKFLVLKISDFFLYA